MHKTIVHPTANQTTERDRNKKVYHTDMTKVQFFAISIVVWMVAVATATTTLLVDAFVIVRPVIVHHQKSNLRPYRTVILAEQESLMEKLFDSTASEIPSTSTSSISTTVIDTAVTDTASSTLPSTDSLSSVASTVAPVVAPITTTTPNGSSIADLSTVALVAGQENYGLAVVLVGEAIWSFTKAPSVDHALKTLLPAIIAAVVLVVVSGPMITSEDANSVCSGLGIATAVSVLMGVAYAARLAAPYSPSPKEIPALGFLVALAGFFSFSQNLVVNGFLTLPSLPSLPSIDFSF
jgi:hypothetical protein